MSIPWEHGTLPWMIMPGLFLALAWLLRSFTILGAASPLIDFMTLWTRLLAGGCFVLSQPAFLSFA